MYIMRAVGASGYGNDEVPIKIDKDMMAFARSVFSLIGRRSLGLYGRNIASIKENNPVTAALRAQSGVEKVAGVQPYLKSSFKTALTAANTVNPVSIAINHGPKFVSLPLQLACDEVRACVDYISHPAKSASELMEYMVKKPSRIAKLLQAAGVPVSTEIMDLIKLEGDVNKAHEVWSVWQKKGIDPVKLQDKGIARFRGKILLTLIKALVDHDASKLSKNIERYLMGMIESSGKRVLAKSLKAALKDKPAGNDTSKQNAKAEQTIKEAVMLLEEELKDLTDVEVDEWFDAVEYQDEEAFDGKMTDKKAPLAA